MRRLKIMSKDIDIPRDPFGTDAMVDALRVFCQKQGFEIPRQWLVHPDDCLMHYAESVHLAGKEQWVEYDATVMFILIDFSGREDRSTEAMQLRCILEDIGEPIILTEKVAEQPEEQQRFFENAGLTKMPVTWMDDYLDYEVYTKGHIEMGAFASLMDRVEFIGKEIVYKCRGDERY